MTWFLVVGGLGLLIVLASLVLEDVFEGLFDALDIDSGAGVFSTPVIGSFLAAFGFGGALVLGSTTAGPAVAAGAGMAAGITMGAIALAITRALMRMATDEPFRLGDLVGKQARVVTPIPPSGYGEVVVSHLGQQMKLNARAERPIARGTDVVVLAVQSASSVVVEEAAEFWGLPAPRQQGE
ncbi:MAG TPA: NfeD family protein [Acidimicrobiales bacterium]